MCSLVVYNDSFVPFHPTREGGGGGGGREERLDCYAVPFCHLWYH